MAIHALRGLRLGAVFTGTLAEEPCDVPDEHLVVEGTGVHQAQ